ncbi:MAG TPA: hypothetical protein VF945_20855 [Polyangia bacterium]
MTTKTNIILWRDLFVIIDDGSVPVDEYARLETIVKEQARKNPGGLGCLVIIPQGAQPPPQEVRRYLDGMLNRLPIRALAYLVEGTGFRAAAARAALVGMRVFSRRSYSTKVASSLDEAIGWLLATLGPEDARKGDLPSACKAIVDGRGAAA